MIIFDLFEHNNKNPHTVAEGNMAPGRAGSGRSELFAELLAKKIAQSYPDGFTLDFTDPWHLAQWLKTWQVKRWAQEFNRLQDYEQSSVIDSLWNELRQLGFEYDTSEQNWEPKQMPGVGRGVTEGIMDVVKQAFNDNVVGWPMGTPDQQFIQGWARDIKRRTGVSVSPEKLMQLYNHYAQSPDIMQTHGTSNESMSTDRDSLAEDEYDQYEAGKMDVIDAVTRMFVRLARQGIDPIDIIADRFGWGTEDLDDLAQQYDFEDSAEWLNSFDQGVAEQVLRGPLSRDARRERVAPTDRDTVRRELWKYVRSLDQPGSSNRAHAMAYSCPTWGRLYRQFNDDVSELLSRAPTKLLAQALEEIQSKFQVVAEGRFEYDKKTGQMAHNTADADQRHGLYINGKLVKTYNSREACDNVKQRDPKFKSATIKKIAETTGDKPFDQMLKGITSKTAVTKQQKIDRREEKKQNQERAKNAFGNMFGGPGAGIGNLSIRKDPPKDVAEAKADPTGSWVVYNGTKVVKFKTHSGAKAYAAKNGGEVASGEYYADRIQKKSAPGVVSEKKTVEKHDADSQDLFSYHGSEPKVRRVLARAHKEIPNAKNDIEAVVGHIATVDDINIDQQRQIGLLTRKLVQAQDNYNQQERRFRDLTSKLRQQGDQATPRDIQAAEPLAKLNRACHL